MCRYVFLVKMLQCASFSLTPGSDLIVSIAFIHYSIFQKLEALGWQAFLLPLSALGWSLWLGGLLGLQVTSIGCMTCYPRAELCWGTKLLLTKMWLRDEPRMSKGPGSLIGHQAVVAPWPLIALGASQYTYWGSCKPGPEVSLDFFCQQHYLSKVPTSHIHLPWCFPSSRPSLHWALSANPIFCQTLLPHINGLLYCWPLCVCTLPPSPPEESPRPPTRQWGGRGWPSCSSLLPPNPLAPLLSFCPSPFLLSPELFSVLPEDSDIGLQTSLHLSPAIILDDSSFHMDGLAHTTTTDVLVPSLCLALAAPHMVTTCACGCLGLAQSVTLNFRSTSVVIIFKDRSFPTHSSISVVSNSHSSWLFHFPLFTLIVSDSLLTAISGVVLSPPAFLLPCFSLVLCQQDSTLEQVS